MVRESIRIQVSVFGMMTSSVDSVKHDEIIVHIIRKKTDRTDRPVWRPALTLLDYTIPGRRRSF